MLDVFSLRLERMELQKRATYLNIRFRLEGATEEVAAKMVKLKEDVFAFEEHLENIEDAFNQHRDYEIFYEQYNAVLDYFNAKTLEGEEHFIVLPEDVIE